MVEPEGAQRLLERGTVEVAPLAFMRGRTLNASFIILDEAQNTTPEQMKMFLTRIGFGSKVVVTGDITQVDVPGGRSGLVGLERVLAGIDGLAFVHLTAATSCATGSCRTSSTPTSGPTDGRQRDAEPSGLVSSAGGEWAATGELEVFVADEQAQVAGRRRRGGSALAERGARRRRRARRRRAVAAVRRRGDDRRAQRAVHGRRRARPTCSRSRSTPTSAWAVPDAGTPGPDRADPDPDDIPLLLGDVVVCPAVARRATRPTHAGTLDDEIALLVVHGVLHVLGMDHAEPEEAADDAGPGARACSTAPLAWPARRRASARSSRDARTRVHDRRPLRC